MLKSHWYSGKSTGKWVQLLDFSHCSANNYLVSLARELKPTWLSFPYIHEQVKLGLLTSFPLRLYQSGDSFTSSMKHKSLLHEEDGWREVAGAGTANQSQVQSCDFIPQQLLSRCSFLLLVITPVAPQDAAAMRA